MTIQQIEYALSIDTYRHFALAAEKCFVTQPTLSMQIKKLEDELGFRIFDRSKHPIIPTPQGVVVLQQSRIAWFEFSKLKDLAHHSAQKVEGDLYLGIIPTLAPYLLPLVLPRFLMSYPNVKVHITELPTADAIQKLRNDILDVAILATPLNESGFNAHRLFDEELWVYLSKLNDQYAQPFIELDRLGENQLWLLEEGHCLRAQILSLCQQRKNTHPHFMLQYESGSIETLKKMVDLNHGLTILPQLALLDLRPEQADQVRRFSEPRPTREISLVTRRKDLKSRMVAGLQKVITQIVPEYLSQSLSRHTD